jgi:hypothetical protein
MWFADGGGTDGKVVQMTDRRSKELVHPALSQLRAYWEGLRAKGDLPDRNDIDPRGIERALEHAFIAERIAPGVARLRLAGMHLNDLMGMEVRGMPLTAFIEPAMRDEMQRQVERAFAGPAAVEIMLESGRGIGRPVLRAKMILLPLRGAGGQVVRVLGGFVAEGEIGRAPRRFRLVSAAATTCVQAERPADPAPVQAPRLVPVAAGFAEAPASFAEPARAKAPPRRGHLTLVHSAD